MFNQYTFEPMYTRVCILQKYTLYVHRYICQYLHIYSVCTYTIVYTRIRIYILNAGTFHKRALVYKTRALQALCVISIFPLLSNVVTEYILSIYTHNIYTYTDMYIYYIPIKQTKSKYEQKQQAARARNRK